MSKHQRRKLTIYYQVGEKRLKQSFRTVQELLDLDTDSHKHNNPMAPTNDTKITCVAWKGCALFDETYSLGEVKRLLKGFDLTKAKHKPRKPTHKYIRKGIYSIDEVRDKVKNVMFASQNNQVKVKFDGDLIKGNSQRYQTFFTKGCKCVKCGIEGKYFAKEKGLKDKSYHLNLYAFDEDGVAHYYGHENIGAYMMLVYEVTNQHSLFVNHNIGDIAFYINYHMLPFQWKPISECDNKWIKIMGHKKYENLWSLHIADLVASKREKGLSEALKAKRGFDNEFDL